MFPVHVSKQVVFRITKQSGLKFVILWQRSLTVILYSDFKCLNMKRSFKMVCAGFRFWSIDCKSGIASRVVYGQVWEHVFVSYCKMSGLVGYRLFSAAQDQPISLEKINLKNRYCSDINNPLCCALNIPTLVNLDPAR